LYYKVLDEVVRNRDHSSVESSKIVAVSDRAADNLRFIRETMERAGAFTAVPGWGGVAMGASALAASWLAVQQSTSAGWLRIWMIELVVALLLASTTMIWKARRTRTSLITGPARRFAMAFAPSVLTGGALSAVIANNGDFALLPPVWLMCYGSGIIAGGLSSVPIIPIMGALFFACGLVSFYPPLGNPMLALGFGVLHLVFGGIIVWRYGG
jgi:hypothetical protein